MTPETSSFRLCPAAVTCALAGVLFICHVPRLDAQIRVHPTGVNVNTQGATTVFLTFGGLTDQSPVEALWCGELISAAPDVGLKCDPATIFGELPIRYDQSRPSGHRGFTDIMSIPPSVTRRAYQAAQQGARSGFFYVRRFVRASGGPDEYVAVTCRLAGGGARSPLSLIDVRLTFASPEPVVFVAPKSTPPALTAAITYTGTGRLKGRWEVVRPGEALPTEQDLLTEATLPAEERAFQRRYTELSRFNEFLPPTGRASLPGPDPMRLPTDVDGIYLVLLRVEASDDKEADSSLSASGAGSGVVHSGAVAGFPMPVLRYVVGGSATAATEALRTDRFRLIDPVEDAVIEVDAPIDFAWGALRQTALYRIEVESGSGELVLAAFVDPGVAGYRSPAWLGGKSPDGRFRWRVLALDATGQTLRFTSWRDFRVSK